MCVSPGRELFPGSDCLKFKDRSEMLADEIRAYPSDIICLQEEDRLDEIPLDLSHSPYSYVQARGPGKKHGLAIMYDKHKYKLVQQKTVQYDVQELSPGLTTEQDDHQDGNQDSSHQDELARRRRGGTRQTKNIGLMVGLERLDEPGKGLIIATTHLYVFLLLDFRRVFTHTSRLTHTRTHTDSGTPNTPMNEPVKLFSSSNTSCHSDTTMPSPIPSLSPVISTRSPTKPFTTS